MVGGIENIGVESFIYKEDWYRAAVESKAIGNAFHDYTCWLL